MAKSTDEELNQMGRISRALEALPTDEARFRALAFFIGRYSKDAQDALYTEAAKARAKASE